jgi:drug/metabolite transporter (DMT)-like permease
MSIANLLRLFAVAALWGASFLFMRPPAQALGLVWLCQMRLLLAAVFLAAVALMAKKPLEWRRNWKSYLVLGVFKSAVPFLLFAYASESAPPSLLSVLNATSPLFGALLGALWLKKPLNGKGWFGVVLGVIGVAIVAGFGKDALSEKALLAVAAGLAASALYGWAATYCEQDDTAHGFANAHGSMWAGALVLLPAMPFAVPHHPPDATVIGSVAALGVLCTGLAYIFYFRMIDQEGAESALCVTFLVPVFGVLWSWLFLHEPVTWNMWLGTACILASLVLVTGLSFRSLARHKAPAG